MPDREFRFVHAEEDNLRLDVYLVDHIRDMTRAQIQKHIEDGLVAVNGRVRKSGYRLRPGDVVDVRVRDYEPPSLEPEDIPLRILYEDEAVAVIDKPSGLVVHPGAGVHAGTLVNALLHRFPEVRAVGAPERPGLVHRLDKETSGVMVIARTPGVFVDLQRQFKRRVVQKTYLALARGRVAASGRIDRPIGRHIKDGQRYSVRTRKPKEAKTDFRVLEQFDDFALLEVKPLTGRTHQIRVHLAAAGHPLFGDRLYGPKKAKGYEPRIFLHAHRLGFLHPVRKEWVEFVSPLPLDLDTILDTLRAAKTRPAGD
ncbi:MAG: RluA family pseudouridine synthase [Candidatus Aminicenantes bacterium]|nr:RluA family pseudouridine synthase [Candidatus Aminicenantes bacterium]